MDRDEIFARIIKFVGVVDQRIDVAGLRMDGTPFEAYGVSSLARVQLAGQVADSFGIELEDSDILLATSPRSLVELVRARVRTGSRDRENLLDSVCASSQRVGPDCGVHYLRHGAPEEYLSYADFMRASARLSRRLPADSTVLVAAENPVTELLGFFATLWVGSRPLILPSPRALGGFDAFKRRLTQVLDALHGEVVLALGEDIASEVAEVAADLRVEPLPDRVADYALAAPGELPPATGHGGEDTAFLQMTSASTGDAKLLAVSHANAHANLTALPPALGMGDDERMVSWLPLHHDMGLVGTALLSFFHGWPLYLMTPTQFVMRPDTWISALSGHRATITAAPNFGYDYAYRRVDASRIEGCDLSALKCAVIGAEPIRLATLDGFRRRFAEFGLQVGCLHCSYGMAESTLATTMPRPGAAPRYVLVDGAALAVGAEVPLLGEGVLGGPRPQEPGTPVFSVGRALSGLTVALHDDDDAAIAADAVLGEVVVTGSSVARGYLDLSDGEPRGFPGGVLRTGDLGFRQRGDLFIVERRKHVIVRHGRNHLATLLEGMVAEILDLDVHKLIVVDSDIFDPQSDITVVVERCSTPPDLTPAQTAALRALDLPVDVLHFSRGRIIPRTTSGKKQYHTMRLRLGDTRRPGDHVVRLSHRTNEQRVG